MANENATKQMKMSLNSSIENSVFRLKFYFDTELFSTVHVSAFNNMFNCILVALI